MIYLDIQYDPRDVGRIASPGTLARMADGTVYVKVGAADYGWIPYSQSQTRAGPHCHADGCRLP